MAAPRSHPNVLAGPYLDRAAHWRKDEQRLLAALADPDTLFVPVWRTQSLIVASEEGPVARMYDRDRLGEIDPTELILLGEFRGRCCFALEIPADRLPEIEITEQFRDLRLLAGDLPADEAGVLAYARAMILWRERHRYCGRCGSPTLSRKAGHVRECSSESCGLPQFPRIDPAVIVLITSGECALLGRQASWLPERYSTIAGFVEPGESLEDAVAREVREETGVIVDRVDYHSSQPWPFPTSLMLGFTAHAATTEVHLHDAELEDARWLSREQIANGEVSLPTTHSISFRLIEDWFDAGSELPLRVQPHVRLWTAPR